MKASLFAFTLILLSAICLLAQEQGYFTTGKEIMRADANWPGAQQQVNPQAPAGPPRAAPQTRGMIGASEANQPSRVAGPPNIGDIVARMNEENRLLAIHQARLEADLQRIRNTARNENAQQTMVALERLITNEQLFGQQRQQWRQQMYDRYGLSQYETVHTPTVPEVRIETGNQSTPQADQQRRQSEQINLNSK